MNPISNLLDEEYVRIFFQKHIMTRYPGFTDIVKIAIKPHKNHIWTTTYHVVIEFETTFKTNEGLEITLPIFCTAHSEEPRKNVYTILRFLRKNSFSSENLTVPRQLYYCRNFRAVFYRGFYGQNLNQILASQDFAKAESVIRLSARWLAKLHQTPAEKDMKFNSANSRIKTALPGYANIVKKIGHFLPDKKNQVEKIYKLLIANETGFLASTGKRWLMHGDFHPENIISLDDGKIGVIDFADFSLGDFARDLGCFLKQYSYMGSRHLDNKEFIARTSDIFLSEYADSANIRIDEQLAARIETYYVWTALRNAIYFALRHNPKRDLAREMIDRIAERIQI